MRKKISLLIFMFISFWATAQTINVKGIVKDAITGDVLPGVSITIKGTTTGTQTDFDGLYSLSNVEKGATLVFNYLGYAQKEVTVNQQTINVGLDGSAESLDEIVVVGYGTQRKKEVTGAVTVIDAEAIERLNPTRVEQALQGQVAGVNITSASGSPGSSSNIRIRGVSTNGDSSPLILVDGNVIVDLSVLNPNDIKSINVLKDATAGIYGVRAANGVVLITTKSGRKESELKFQLDAWTGIQSTSKKIDLLNARDFALYVNDAGDKTRFFVYPNKGTDWQDEVFDQAMISSVNFSASGGTKKAAYTFGVSRLDQDGIVGVGKSNFTRTTARIGFNYDILDNLKLSTTGLFTNSEKNNLPEGGIGSVLYSAVNVNPDLAIRDENGNFSTVDDISQIEIINPLAQIANNNNTTRIDRYSATIGLDYTFLKNFTASSKFQINHATVLYDSFSPIADYGPGKSANRLQEFTTDFSDIYDDYTWDNYINYTNIFNDDHDLTVLLGTSIFKTTGEQFYGSSQDGTLVQPRVIDFDIARGVGFFDSRLSSIFTRLQYSYKGKYLLSAVLRRDGSTSFGPNNKFGYFPSASVGWNVSDEPFFEDNKVINSLKIRASYGVIGNDKIPGGAFVSLLNGEGVYASNNEVTQEDLLFGVAIGKIGNPDIRWEKQKSANIGFDASFLDRKVKISMDAFSKRTEDLLIAPQVSGLIGPYAPGASTPVKNAGTVENKGFEFKIDYNDSFSEDFKFNMSFNFTTIDNEVLFVSSDSGFEQGGDFGVGLGIFTSRMEAGFPMGYFHGFKTDGLYQTQAEIDALNASSPNGIYHNTAGPGDLKFVDTNGDGEITDADKAYIGDPIADLTMGFNIGFSYKNFDFSANAFASIGNDMVRDYERKDLYANRGTYMLDRWQGTGTSNTVPRAFAGASINTDNFSDFFVEDASFVRLQNIQVGYTIQPSSLAGSGISKLRIYLTGNNLFTITDYTGYDPSASSGSPIGAGVDKGFYPVASSYLLGVNLNF
ncbi:SusC/RagA family TonB-linked outer membrane protein [Polaribacter filamentus]|nr:TonB-dependent receptor [Polaribacter filamentus]